VGPVAAGELPGRLDAIQLGYPYVHDRHVGTVLAGEAHRFLAVAGLGDHLDVLLGVDDRAQPFAHQVLVVGEQDPDHDAGPLSGRRASTVNPPSPTGPAASSPPRRATRSRIPARP
jgi:hypothetical protein